MSVLAPNPPILCRESCNYRDHQQHQQQQQQIVGNRGGGGCLSFGKSYNNGFGIDNGKSVGGGWKKMVKRSREMKVNGGFFPDLSRPSSVEMLPITDCEQLDQILAKAAQLNQPIIIDWMAAWCRKCIYLKPKLEKLAADFDTKLKFYCVDVNNVPQALVKRGNVSKMPTIQLWKDGEMKEEVIGGHKAWLVIEEVREMIKKFV